MFLEGYDLYGDAIKTKWCVKGNDVAGRNGCTSDATCLENGRKLCDGDPTCFGISWYPPRANQWLRLCRSNEMEDKSDGWHTMMKIQGNF